MREVMQGEMCSVFRLLLLRGGTVRANASKHACSVLLFSNLNLQLSLRLLAVWERWKTPSEANSGI